MKGKFAFWYDVPESAKIRTRITSSNSAEITSLIRKIFHKSAIEVLNQRQDELIAKVQANLNQVLSTSEDTKFKDNAAKLAILSYKSHLLSSIWGMERSDIEVPGSESTGDSDDTEGDNDAEVEGDIEDSADDTEDSNGPKAPSDSDEDIL